MRRVSDYEVADGKAGDLTCIEHFAHMAIAERNRLGEFATDGGERGEEPFAADLGEHRAEFFRLLTSFAQPAAAAELDQHALRTEGDQRPLGAHKQTAAMRTGRGYVEEFGMT